MPSYAELREEKVWRDQFVPPNLQILVTRLESHYQPGVTNIGAYGDYRHLRGYHRSRNWIFGSRWCTNHRYSVTETVGNVRGGNGNWISGIDIVVGQAESRHIHGRLHDARRDSRIGYMREILLERSPWHVHISLDRAHADTDHNALFNVITGCHRNGGSYVNVDVQLPLLRQGADGVDVATAQGLLCARGNVTRIDGDFGPDTHEKTLDMQRRYSAEKIDGIWGPETWTIGITGEDKL